jgi:hypothetical protein
MNAIEIDFSELQRLQAQMAQSPNVVREELLTAMTEADLLVEREVKERTPHAHGLLRDSIRGVETVVGLGVEGFVGTSLSYVQPVELGTRPHFPPVEALIDWVKVKLGIQSDREARGVAFLIARKIAAKGTKGAEMFAHTLQAVEAQVRAIFSRAQDRIAARLAG